MGGHSYETETERLQREVREELEPIIAQKDRELEEKERQIEELKKQLAEIKRQ